MYEGRVPPSAPLAGTPAAPAPSAAPLGGPFGGRTAALVSRRHGGAGLTCDTKRRRRCHREAVASRDLPSVAPAKHQVSDLGSAGDTIVPSPLRQTCIAQICRVRNHFGRRALIEFSGSIHGAYRLAGSGIFEAEISIRHSPEKKTGTAQFNTEINTTHPYQLHQLQDATNHLSLALSALEEASLAQNVSFSIAQRVPRHIWMRQLTKLQALQDVLGRLQAAEQSINAPSHRCFPSVISPQCVRNQHCPEPRAHIHSLATDTLPSAAARGDP